MSTAPATAAVYATGGSHVSRGRGYTGIAPDKITLYRGPLERFYEHKGSAMRSHEWFDTRSRTTSGSVTNA